MQPEPLTMVWVALLVLAVAVVLETFSLLGCLREVRHIRGNRPFRDWLRHTRNSALVVVLGEDIAALIGLVLAFIFVALAALTGNTVFDALGSICIGVVLLTISVLLVARVQSLLVGRSADPQIQEAIAEIIRKHPDIEQVFNTITMQFGPDTMLAAKIRLKSGLDIDTAVVLINDLERELKARIPELRWCFVEPDTED
jgi:divalent metal cation (Fe/Co/Zn/Cd) transporter